MPKFPGYDQFYIELNQAESARRDGNEGKARVCARRAAGVLIGEYLRRRGYEAGGSSAYERLKSLQVLPNVPDEVRIVSSHFLLRANPEGNLPEDVDLIGEARRLESILLVVEKDNL